ncbi:MAG: hypothetical protein HXX08_04580 [Chloroflexi bacterium]|jgi:hypothetical protein|uniref:Uncharacterized protein n=1 Tax=Candidatus Chlorohelix allophototropha TaxID=3003348 RepID=A0A8T7LW85_9CHLR|nr:hypothetical protein [Chloroflexota bacterium]WJW67016.1 hypothetical protein OZ401_000264 [Chloroflexota bacterium L227-S17]
MENKISGKCPHCSSTNLASEPVYPFDETEMIYDYDDEEESETLIAVFCVTCGHYLGAVESELRQGKRDWHSTMLNEFKRAIYKA